MKKYLDRELSTSLMLFCGAFSLIGAVFGAIFLVGNNRGNPRTKAAALLTLAATGCLFFFVLLFAFIGMLAVSEGLIMAAYILAFVEVLAFIALGVVAFFVPSFLSPKELRMPVITAEAGPVPPEAVTADVTEDDE